MSNELESYKSKYRSILSQNTHLQVKYFILIFFLTLMFT
jgi:hypothetical protein